MCPTCGFLLASGPLLDQEPRKRTALNPSAPRRPVSSLERLENSKKGIAVVVLIVVVVIVASLYLYVNLHGDDAYLGATLFFRYSAGNSTSGPNVHVWGSVYNWGESSGSGKITIIVTDDEGHRFEDSFRVGPISPHEGVSVDKTYPWNHVYDPIEHPVAPVEVSYSI